MAVYKQTRSEYYDYCKEHKLLLPEVSRPTDVVGTDAYGNKLLIREGDVNENDVREWDPEIGEASATPWRRP